MKHAASAASCLSYLKFCNRIVDYCQHCLWSALQVNGKVVLISHGPGCIQLIIDLCAGHVTAQNP